MVNVYYKAIDVPYAARFYFQNIHDDFYTEDVSLYQQRTARPGTIITNEMLAADAAFIARYSAYQNVRPGVEGARL